VIDSDVNSINNGVNPYAADSHDNNMSLLDVISDDMSDSEPTIIDFFHSLIRRCCCCCKCQCCNGLDAEARIYRQFKSDDGWQDEVEKALHENKYNKNAAPHHQIFSIDFDENPLRTELIEHTELSRSFTSKSKLLSKKQRRKRSAKSDKLKGARMRCYCLPCMSYRPLLWQLISISIVIQLLGILIMGTIDLVHDSTKHSEFRLFVQILLGIFWFVQLIVVIQIILTSIKNIWHLSFFEILLLYLTSLLLFTFVYATAYFYDDDDDKKILSEFQAFNLESTEFSAVNFGERMIVLFYFSCSQQTLCGISEIIPKSPVTMFLSGVQMMIGMFFGIVIISIGISRLGEDLEARYHHLEKEREREKRRKEKAMRASYDNLVASMSATASCWKRFRDQGHIIAFRRTTRKYLLLIIVAIQLTKNMLEWQTTDSSFADKHSEAHSLIFIAFDILNVSIVIMTSLKFVHIGHMTELSLNFLCQTYLSVVLIFTGIYADVQVSSSHSAYGTGAFDTGATSFGAMWTKFMYFSFAIMTLCGAGLDIKPRSPYAALVICAQMLIGLFFHVYIFGIGLLLLANKKYKSSNTGKRSKKNTIGSDGPKSVLGDAPDHNNSELIMSTLLQQKQNYALL